MFNELLPWILPTITIFGFDDYQWKKIFRILLIQTALTSLILVLWTIPNEMKALGGQVKLGLGMGVGRLNLLDIETQGLYVARDALSGSLLLVMGITVLNFRDRFVAMTGLVVLCFIYVIGQFRSGTFMCLVAVTIGFAFISSKVKKNKRSTRLHWTGIIIISIILLSSLSGFLPTKLSDSRYFTLRYIGSSLVGVEERIRFEDASNITMRIKESEYALSESSLFELFCGKGIAGEWSGRPYYIERRSMLHFGPGYLIFKGGFPLLLLVCIVPFGVGLRCVYCSRDAITFVCASYICLYMVVFFMYCIFMNSLAYVLLFLCAGRCMRELGFTKKTQFNSNLRV